MNRPFNILFLCTGNFCRSQMYEAEMNMPGVVVDNKVVHAGNVPVPDPVRHSARE